MRNQAGANVKGADAKQNRPRLKPETLELIRVVAADNADCPVDNAIRAAAKFYIAKKLRRRAS